MEQEITPFDNRYSLLYKRAAMLNTLARLILVRGNPEILESYISLSEALPEVLQTKNDLIYAYSVLFPLSLPGMEFNITDLVITYIRVTEDIDLDVINAFLEEEQMARVSNGEDLGFITSNWNEAYKVQVEKDRNYLQYIIDLQTDFSKIEPLPTSSLVINRLTMRSSLVYSKASTETLDTLSEEIFDSSTVSLEVPLIIFTDRNGKTVSKVWTSLTIKSLIPSLPPTRSSMYVVVWTGEVEKEEDRIKKVTKESYTVGKIDLTSSELVIDIPIHNGKTKNIALDRLKEAMPIDYRDMTVAKSAGDFNVYNIKIVEAFFLDMLLTSQPFYSYIYMPEESKAAFEKKKFSIHVRTIPVLENTSLLPTETTLFSSVASSITQFVSDGSMVNVDGELTQLPEGVPYISVSVARANSNMDAKQYLQIFSRLLRLYLSDYGEIEELYKEMFPEAVYEVKVKKIKKAINSNARLHQLRQVAPDIFIKGYARKCQKSYQPIVIPNSQIEDWTSSTFRLRGKEIHRQVMPYPPDNPRINIICPSDKYPFPGVKENTLPKNREIYPYIPCCFGSNQMKPGKYSDYNYYYNGLAKKKINYLTKGRILTSKILGYKRSGNLPHVLTTFLNSFYDEETDFIRIGVPRDVNSAISCAILATKGLKTKLDEDSISALAAKTRRNLKFYTSLYKQELWDLTSQEIKSQLKSQEIFFDPRLFYRAIEETFHVNILSFSSQGPIGREVVTFDVPRHAYFHAQSFQDRPLVMLYRNYGSESDALSYPQMELIANMKQKTPLSFRKPYNERMFDAFTEYSSVYIWNPDQAFLSTQLPYHDYLAPLPIQPRYQYLDEYGKMRGIVSDELTVFFPPSSPLNLPVTKAKHTNNLESVLQLGDPSAGYYIGDEIWGLWYPSSAFPYTYFFPLDKPYSGRLPPGPISPFPFVERSNAEEVMKDYADIIVKRNILLQLLSWAFLTTKLDWPEDPVTWFVDKYTIIGQDQNSNYSFSSISRILPEAKTFPEVIEYLSTFPGLIVGEKIYLYNPKFAAGVTYFLQSIVKSYPREKLLVPREIYGLPFRKRPFTLLFETWEALDRWEKELNISAFLTIYSSIDETFSKFAEPYFYRPDNVLYLVLNVPEVSSAVFVWLRWQETRTIPEIIEKASPGDNVVNVYTISGNGKLEGPELDNSIPILDYGNGTYAILLSL